MSTSNDPLDEAAQDSLIPAIPRGKISSDFFADARKKSQDQGNADNASRVCTAVGRLVGLPLNVAYPGDFPLRCATCGAPLSITAVGGPYIGINHVPGSHAGCSDCAIERVIDAKNVLDGVKYYEIPEKVSLVPDPNSTSPLAAVLDHVTLHDYVHGSIPADTVHKALEKYLSKFSDTIRGTPASDLIPLLTLFIQGGTLLNQGSSDDDDEDEDAGEEWKKQKPTTDTEGKDDPFFFQD